MIQDQGHSDSKRPNPDCKNKDSDLHKYQNTTQNCQKIEILAVFYAQQTGAQEIKSLVKDHIKAWHNSRN